MIADLTKRFFQIGLPPDQRDLFHILWFDNYGIDEGGVKAIRFTRCPWDIKSSPFIASFAIQKTLEKNVTGSSDLKQKLIQINIYMGDLIFSVDNLDDARLIADEAIELFHSGCFRLVKWSGNEEVVPVLSKFAKDVLAAGIHELDLSLNTNESLSDTKAFGCVNQADVASRPDGINRSESRKLWFNGSEFLRLSDKIPVVESSAVSVKRVTCAHDKNKFFPEESY